jgi:hypothetical protein
VWRQQPDQSDPDDDKPDDYEYPTWVLHGLLLSGLPRLGLGLLHLLPQVGELGRWFPWRLALVLRHGSNSTEATPRKSANVTYVPM